MNHGLSRYNSGLFLGIFPPHRCKTLITLIIDCLSLRQTFTISLKSKKNEHHLYIRSIMSCSFFGAETLCQPTDMIVFFCLNVVSRDISSSLVCSRSWKETSIRFSFCWSVIKRGTNFATTQCMLNFSIRMLWHNPTGIPTSSASSLTVRRRFSCTIFLILWKWTPSVKIEIDWFTTVFESGKPFVTLRTMYSITSVSLLEKLESSRENLLRNRKHLVVWDVMTNAVLPTARQRCSIDV